MHRTLRALAAALALALVALVVPTGTAQAAPAPSVRTQEQRIEVAGGPGSTGPVSLDTTLYLPATTPAPAVLVAHGFGGSKASVDSDARDLASHGFVVLTWSARGFGASTGQISLDDPDHEVADARALVDWLATRPEVTQDGPGDPRVGVTGDSYGGALALLLAGYDRRIDAIAPVITWNDLNQALFPNDATTATLPTDTPAHAAAGPDGVFKRGWGGLLFSVGAAPPGNPSAASGPAASGGAASGGAPAPADDSARQPAGSPAPAAAPANDPAPANSHAGSNQPAGTPAPAGTAPVDDSGTSQQPAGSPPSAATPANDPTTANSHAGSNQPAGTAPADGPDRAGGSASTDQPAGARTSSDASGGPGASAGRPAEAPIPAAPGSPTIAPATGPAAAPATPLTCGRFTAALCAAYTEAATTGRLSPAIAALLHRSSPSTVTDRITAPTLLVQGEQDTLFGLDQADANARQIAANGTPVKVMWYGGGHDGGDPGASVREAIDDWFAFHLAHTGPNPGTGFAYTVQSGVRTGGSAPNSRTVEAPDYPGISGSAPVETQRLGLDGAAQVVVNPAGASPAAITSLPGAGAALGSLAGRLSAATAEVPGQSAQFRTAALATPTLVAGVPRVGLSISRVPGQPAPADAVLFARTFEVSPDGLRTLLGSAVAPIRVPVPADGTPARVTVTLPGVVAPVEAGNHLVVSINTTDQAFAGDTEPAVWRVGLAGDDALTVPVVPGTPVMANTVPLWPLIGIAVVLALALLAWGAARILGRRARAGTEAAADPGAPPLEVRALAKTYRGGFSAVKDVSFTVRKGMVLGLLGPNGAGKTTVLRMLMGLIRPTAGTITAFGQPVGPGAPVLARIGAFVEGPGFLPHLSGLDNLRLYWAATGRPAEEAHLDEALQIAGLGASVQRRVGTYSQGMRQRLAIAQAMLGLPELLVLDEPTNGLDPPQIHAMREVLRRYAAGGRTVVVSSHLLAEVEQTCSHVVVMHRGKVVADGTVDDIIAGGGAATFAVDAPDRAAEVLGSLTGVHAVSIEGGAVHAELNGTPRASAVRALVTAGVDVTSAGPRRRLEDAFLQLVGEDAEKMDAAP